jgi:signal transduction histidine kinase
VSFRARVLLAFVPVALVPLVVFGLGARRVARERLSAQYELRVASLARRIRVDLARRSDDVDRRLAALSREALADNRLRSGVLGVSSARPYLLDWAGAAMRIAGLDMLQLTTEDGRILSSGHFRNAYDRLATGLDRRIAAAPAGALVHARGPAGTFLVLARSRTLHIAGRTVSLTGGVALDTAFVTELVPDSDLRVALVTPRGTLASRAADAPVAGGGERAVAEFTVPWVPDAAEGGPPGVARVVVSHSLEALDSWRGALDDWLRVAALVAVAAALLLALWLSFRVSRPLARLAGQAERIDLDRLDVEFATERGDEIGALARVLHGMTGRLRAGRARLLDAERRATLGELARQVNHDVKNGLAPLRHVFRHLWDVARREPAELPRALEERRDTIESGLAYLERLAANYARLTPALEPRPCDLNAAVREVVALAPPSDREQIALRLGDGLPPVRADPVLLRRVIDNLLRNAIEALADRQGRATVTSEPFAWDSGAPGVRLIVADTGQGITAEALERALAGFYTTKPGGTGLGLSIVRRLVLDLSGRLRVDIAPGAGSRFIVELPGAAA